MSPPPPKAGSGKSREQNWLIRLLDWKPFLVVALLPAVGLLMVFLTYPLGLGIWLAFTDTTIGRSAAGRGSNFEFMLRGPDLVEQRSSIPSSPWRWRSGSSGWGCGSRCC